MLGLMHYIIKGFFKMFKRRLRKVSYFCIVIDTLSSIVQIVQIMDIDNDRNIINRILYAALNCTNIPRFPIANLKYSFLLMPEFCQRTLFYSMICKKYNKRIFHSLQI